MAAENGELKRAALSAEWLGCGCARGRRGSGRARLSTSRLIYFDVLHRFTRPGRRLAPVAGWQAGWQTGESMPLGMRAQAQCHLAITAECRAESKGEGQGEGEGDGEGQGQGEGKAKDEAKDEKAILRISKMRWCWPNQNERMASTDSMHVRVISWQLLCFARNHGQPLRLQTSIEGAAHNRKI